MEINRHLSKEVKCQSQIRPSMRKHSIQFPTKICTRILSMLRILKRAQLADVYPPIIMFLEVQAMEAGLATARGTRTMIHHGLKHNTIGNE